MRDRRPALVCGLLILAAVARIDAADPAIEVKLHPERFGVEDLTRLVVTVYDGERRADVPQLGQLDNLQVVSGPSTENHFSWVNGVATSSLRFIYVLQALEVGPARVASITVTVGEVVLTSQPLTAEVVPGSLAPPRRDRRRPRDPFWDPFGDAVGRRSVREPQVALRQLVSDIEVVLGQPVIATVVLDTTVTGIEGFEWVSAPSYPGWWDQRVELPNQISPELVERGGVRYHRYTIARHVLVPLKAGQLTLPAVSAKIGIRARSVFAPLQVVEQAANEVDVEVVQRPQAPEGFAGAVGQLEYGVQLVPESIAFGESAVLTIELEGTGNLPLVEAPAQWPTCEGCDVYPPEEENNVRVDQTGIRGARKWSMTVVPRQWGQLRLEPVILAVFDPKAGRFRRQTLGPLTLAVTPPPPTPTPQVVLAEAAVGEADAAGSANGSRTSTRVDPSSLGLVAFALVAGVLGGGLGMWMVVRRRATALPPRRPGQSPAVRARELQVVLERWWLGVRDSARADALKTDMEQLRQELEAIRFAPGRADHSHTITDLEERFKKVLRRA